MAKLNEGGSGKRAYAWRNDGVASEKWWAKCGGMYARVCCRGVKKPRWRCVTRLITEQAKKI